MTCRNRFSAFFRLLCDAGIMDAQIIMEGEVYPSTPPGGRAAATLVWLAWTVQTATYGSKLPSQWLIGCPPVQAGLSGIGDFTRTPVRWANRTTTTSCSGRQRWPGIFYVRRSQAKVRGVERGAVRQAPRTPRPPPLDRPPVPCRKLEIELYARSNKK